MRDLKTHFVTAATLLTLIVVVATAVEASTEDPTPGDEASSQSEEADDDDNGGADDVDQAPSVTSLGESDRRQLDELVTRLRTATGELRARVDAPLTVDEALRQIPAPRSPEQIFDWIDEQIDFEPYRGSIRGSEGALVAGRANAADQAVLADRLLDAAGHNARFVTGTLRQGDANQLLDETRGSAVVASSDGSATLDPEDVEEPDLGPLRDAARDHVWLEVDTGRGHRDFDPVAAPSFGIGIADADEHHDELPQSHQASLEIELISELDDNRSLEHAAVEASLPEIAFESMTLSFEDDPTRRHGFEPHLSVGEEMIEGLTIPADSLERLDLTFRFRTARHEHRWQQVLYRRGQGADVFDFDHQHFAIAIAPGPVSADYLQRLAAESIHNSSAAVDTWMDAESDEGRTPQQRRRHINDVLDEFGAVFPYAFTHTLDRTTDQLADRLGVRSVMNSPRVLTAGLLRDGEQFHLDIQIDGDRFRAFPKAGIPPFATTAFVGLYGLMRDRLTREMLAAYGDHQDTTVRRIFQLVTEQAPQLTSIHGDTIDEIDDLDSGDAAKEIMNHQVRDRDMVLLTPTAPVEDGDIERYGWWAVNPHRGNIEGHTSDALLTAEKREDDFDAPADARPLIQEHLVLLARHFQAVDHATGDEMRFPELTCSASNLYAQLSRIFCAESQPKPEKDLRACFDDEVSESGGGGLAALTQVECADLMIPTRCAASYADAVVGGRLGVADDATSTPQPALCP